MTRFRPFATTPIAAAIPIATLTASTTAGFAAGLQLLLRLFVAGLFAAGRSHTFVVFARLLEEVRNVKKGVALQAEFDEGGLHPRQDARHAALMNAAYQRILIGTLKVNLN